MAQQSRMLAAIPEDLSLDLSTSMRWLSTVCSPPMYQIPSYDLCDHWQMCGMHLCTCMRVYSCKDVPMEFKQQLSGISFFCDRETSRQNSGKHLDQLSHLGSP